MYGLKEKNHVECFWKKSRGLLKDSKQLKSEGSQRVKSRGWVWKRRRKKGKQAERFKTPRLVGYERVKKSRGQYLSGGKKYVERFKPARSLCD